MLVLERSGTPSFDQSFGPTSAAARWLHRTTQECQRANFVRWPLQCKIVKLSSKLFRSASFHKEQFVPNGRFFLVTTRIASHSSREISMVTVVRPESTTVWEFRPF